MTWIDSKLTIMGEKIAARVAREEYCLYSCGTWSWMGYLRLSKIMRHENLKYADNLVIMAKNKYNTTVRDRMQEALNITEWMKKE